jgi:hypothetical protein
MQTMGSPALALTMLNAFVDGGVAPPVHLWRLFDDDFVRVVYAADGGVLEVDQIKTFRSLAGGDAATGMEHYFDASCARAVVGAPATAAWSKTQMRVRVAHAGGARAPSHAFTVSVFPSGRVQLQGKPPDPRAPPCDAMRFLARTACLVHALLERNGAARRVPWACLPRVALWVYAAHAGIAVHGWGVGASERLFAELLAREAPDAVTRLSKASACQRRTVLAHRRTRDARVHLCMWRTGSIQAKVSAVAPHAAHLVPSRCTELIDPVVRAVETAVTSRLLLHSRGAPRVPRCENAARELAWLTLRHKPMRQYTTHQLQALLAAEGVSPDPPLRPGMRWRTGAYKKWLFVQAKQATEAPAGCDLGYLLDLERCFAPCRIARGRAVADGAPTCA